MVQLRFLSGSRSGSAEQIRRFPCVIGRSASANFRLEEPGIWDRHLQLNIEPGRGITFTVLDGALLTVNGQRLSGAVLHNGDVIEAGGTRIQFWLSPTRQRSTKVRELMTWVALALLSAGQIALIYALLR